MRAHLKHRNEVHCTHKLPTIMVLAYQMAINGPPYIHNMCSWLLQFYLCKSKVKLSSKYNGRRGFNQFK